jgi:predicted LPLAT superfamily acyltransferase
VSSAQHWASKQESGSYLGIQLLLVLYKYGGKWLILLFLAPILGYFFLKDRTARTASLSFLQRSYQYDSSVSPFKSKPGYWQSYCHFWQFALAALAKIDVWLGRISEQQIIHTGSVRFTDLIAEGKGGVLVASHLGNTEVCRALAKTKYHTRINVLVFTHHAAAFNKALKKLNQQMDMDLIQVSHFSAKRAGRAGRVCGDSRRPYFCYCA